MNVPKFLAVMVVLQGLILASIWGGGQWSRTVRAEPFDPAAQRIQTVDELKALNAKMDKLIGILEGGKLQVQVVKPDDNAKDAGK